VTDWRTLAACLDEDPDAFFPDPTDTPAITYAKSICTGCPVQITCLETAIREEAGRGLSFRAGIRGGKTPAQRVREYWRRARDRAGRRRPAEAEAEVGPEAADVHRRQDARDHRPAPPGR
jgi:hypothetical protein